MKSMTETNSGKLISLISADLFIIERGMSIFALNFAAPFISLFTCYLLNTLIGIEYTLMVFAIWAATMFLQFKTTQKYKIVKGIESAINDERLKLVNDLVAGCRTIKCYGWENHYIQQINLIRDKQMKHVMVLNIL